MRHFDAWLLRDPYSIFHYYPTGRRWQETVRDLIQERKICSPCLDPPYSSTTTPIEPCALPMASQSDCGLLSRLPPEIRLMIYGYVFGDEAVHLVQVKNKIRHVRCRHPVSSVDQNRRCCPSTPAHWRQESNKNHNNNQQLHHHSAMLYPHTHADLPSALSNSSLALLRCCRAIYAEAADILYANVVFDVDDLHTFIAFSRTVGTDRLRSIRRLTVQWSPVWQPMAGHEQPSSIFAHTHNDRLWSLFWSRVAALRGLEELHLSVDLGRFSGTPAGGLIAGKQRLRLAIDEPWVAPMLCVRGLQSFELGITARCDTYAKRVLEGDLVRDAVTLRDHLRAILCSPPGSVPSIPGVQLQLKRPCGIDELNETVRPTVRPRLAITAA
ncbi:hypothetical protein EYZ11_008321 [Aspergillus tanneri]|uniref:DUF7730 domain-containing protein n=1 Tax=Aspergillus tanneri TaxID=1220188 RepID=A0A4S3JD17_9EURO|nr:uncharacterized protein ATNIH1004_001108 [Aspergillus tanneri]KAA8652204.1 hypothetical protein ATNIH1004_001108 [Aspergillus tanneri]THC92228.1 hypothetical protein EYZ11_008321 [Aspergillus tanneri]